MHEPLGDDLRRFILTSIPSVPYLEAMLQLHRARPLGHTSATLAAAIYVSEAAASALLQGLAAAGVARVAKAAGTPASGGDAPLFEYAPTDAALAASIDALAGAYSRDLVGVTRLIHDSTQRSAMHFADAFKFKKGS